MKPETLQKYIDDYMPAIADDIRTGSRYLAEDKLKTLLKIVEKDVLLAALNAIRTERSMDKAIESVCKISI